MIKMDSFISHMTAHDLWNCWNILTVLDTLPSNGTWPFLYFANLKESDIDTITQTLMEQEVITEKPCHRQREKLKTGWKTYGGRKEKIAFRPLCKQRQSVHRCVMWPGRWNFLDYKNPEDGRDPTGQPKQFLRNMHTFM